ncbi:MAG TPA: type II toxin-antitoxin system HicB family antitoxin [Thermoanaerobaculia bacterium]|nr:type II toxin-antitoxin system HicB family antitoxin [Thermoanaerobaculia bacterium]
MTKPYTLEYWPDEGGLVGRLREVPGVFSQGENLSDLEANIRDAFELLLEDERELLHPGAQVKQIEIEVPA